VTDSALNRELNIALGHLLEARERLTALEFIAFVAVMLERYVKESARLDFGDALRARRSRA
jgi:hypothetical protein